MDLPFETFVIVYSQFENLISCSTNQKQQPKQEEQQPPPKAVKKPSPQEKPAEKSKDTGKEDSTPKRHKPNPEELKKTVFVGNLPISFDKKVLKCLSL